MIIMALDSSRIIELAESGYYTQKDGCRNYYEVHGFGPQKIVLLQGSLALFCILSAENTSLFSFLPLLRY